MKQIGKVLLSPIVGVASLLKKPKDPPKPLPTVSRET